MSEEHRPASGPPWSTVRKETVGRYKLFDLVRTVRRSPTTGREHEFVVLHAPDWVNVVALTDERQLILVEQYRHGSEDHTVEIPGGCVDQGEDAMAAASRELEEETGFRARRLHLLGEVEPNPAFLSNRCWTFLALDCRRDGSTCLDPAEEITVRLVEPAGFTELIEGGVIRHSLVVAAHDHLHRALRRGEPLLAGLVV